MTNLARSEQHRPVVREMYRRIWEFGLAHGERRVSYQNTP